MINIENVSWSQIAYLCKILSEYTNSQIVLIKRRFLELSKNFEDTLEMLKILNIVKQTDNNLYLDESIKESTLNEKKMKELTIQRVIENSSSIASLDDFLESFKYFDNSYISILSRQQRLNLSGLRNFLINLEVLDFDPKQMGYVAKGTLIKILKNRNKIFTYQAFMRRQESEKRVGATAEVIVFEKEKRLFSGNSDLQNKIRHISIENVLAGYDILSYRLQEGKMIPRYIEVKAISLIDRKFFWSRNEIEIARRLKNDYFLYLVPVEKNGALDGNLIQEIKNPYTNVFLNKNWLSEIELLSFSKTN